LNKLLAAGILSETERLGRERRFKANTEHFLFPELQGIARKTFGLVAPIRDALAPFEGQIQQAFVFGSVVTGKDTARSDVDVLVVGDASYLTLIMAVTALEGVLGRPVHLNLYAPAEWARLIAEDGVIQLIAMGPRLNIFPRPPEEGESQ
jgi:predicted nucleotidyltransferase